MRNSQDKPLLDVLDQDCSSLLQGPTKIHYVFGIPRCTRGDVAEFPIIITPLNQSPRTRLQANIAVTSCLSSLFELQTNSLPASNLMADLKSRIGGKRKYFSNLVWKREDQLGHPGHPKRATSLTYNSRREENAPADYDSDASSIASSDCGEEAYFLPSNGEGRGEGPTAPFRRFRSAEPISLLKRIELPVFSTSSPTKRANAVEESPKRLIERIGNGLYAVQHTPIMLDSEDMDVDSTPAPEEPINEEAPNGHVWTDQAIHEAGAVSGINLMAVCHRTSCFFCFAHVNRSIGIIVC